MTVTAAQRSIRPTTIRRIMIFMVTLPALMPLVPVAEASHCPLVTGPCAWITGGSGWCTFPGGACSTSNTAIHRAILGGTGVLLLNGQIVDTCHFPAGGGCTTNGPVYSWNCYQETAVWEAYTFTANGAYDYDLYDWNPC